MDSNYSILALGDSYTIGEGVPLFESFPCQTVQLLRRQGKFFYAPEIIAKTGWTTGELMEEIDNQSLLLDYDIVSLLIGVNNQYRGRSQPEYADQFEALLQWAIQLSVETDPGRVFVLSIPDWGVTTFGQANLPDTKGRSAEQVATEIDAFNEIARRISTAYGVTFIDITTHTRQSGAAAHLLAADGLHPSGKEYECWAQELASAILTRI